MSSEETKNPESIIHEVGETSSSVNSVTINLHDRDQRRISASPPPALPLEDLRQLELMNITNGGNKQSIEVRLNENCSIVEKDTGPPVILDITPSLKCAEVSEPWALLPNMVIQLNENNSISEKGPTLPSMLPTLPAMDPYERCSEVSGPWISLPESNRPRDPCFEYEPNPTYANGGNEQKMEVQLHGHSSIPWKCPCFFGRRQPRMSEVKERFLPLAKNKSPGDASFDNEPNPSSAIDKNKKEVNSYITCSVVEKFIALDDALNEKSPPKIQKVPFILRDNNFKKFYGPRVMAIGPYHHQNSNLKETENMKLKLAALFIQDYSMPKEVLYSKIRSEIKHLRECYEENEIESFTDDDLAWIFFVDGCAILQYIYCYCACLVNDNTKNEDTSRKDKIIGNFRDLNMKVDFLTIVERDLFLLENQLPFQVLELLTSYMQKEKQDEMMKSIESFIFENIKAPGEELVKEHKPKHQSKRPSHLLDLLRTRLLEENQISCSRVHQAIKTIVEFMSAPIKNLMECIGKVFENCPCQQTNSLNFFRNVEELKAAGIRFRPSNTGRLADITFSLGTLKLPSIVVDDSTTSKLMNLIAYEMSSTFLNDLGVSSYLAFLDTLIDQAQDVKELRDKQILYNLLGSDEEVANLLSEMSTNIVSNPEKYKDVKRGIQKRYGNKSMTWIAQLNHQYFQNPWSMIAFVAATLALALTVVQTVYSVWSFYK